MSKEPKPFFKYWLFLFALLLVSCEDGLASGTVIFEGVHQFDSQTELLRLTGGIISNQ